MFLSGLIIDIRDETAQPSPARLDPAVMLFDGLFLRQFFSPNPDGPAFHLGYGLKGKKEIFFVQ